MDKFTIVVTIEAKDQGAAFRYIEDALDYAAENSPKRPPDYIHVGTPDGTKSTLFTGTIVAG